MNRSSRSPCFQFRVVARVLLFWSCFAAAGSVSAQTIWTAGTGNWNTAANWSLGVPNSASGTTFDAQIKNGGTAQLLAPGASVRRMRAGVFAGGGHLEVNGGGLTITEDLILNFEGTSPASTTVQLSGTVTARDAIVGYSSTGFSNFLITGAGSSVNVATSFTVGLSGGGALALANGGALSGVTGTIAQNAGSVATASVSGAGSSWTNTGGFAVGFNGNASLIVQSGGVVSNTFGVVGRNLDSSASVQVLGPGSTWTNNQDLQVGRAGAGTLSILGGGAVYSTYGELGTFAGSVGTANVNGTGSTWNLTADLRIGLEGTGNLTVANGGRVATTSFASLGDSPGSSGAARVDGPGSTLDVADSLIIGGFDGGGAGLLAIHNGGRVTNDLGYIGYTAGSSGTVTVDGPGSTWTNNNRLFVGTDGYGSLAITGGGQVTSVGDAIIGYNNDEDSGEVEVTGAGSNWTVSDVDPAGLYVGFLNGAGVLSVNTGGVVNANVPNGIQVGNKGTVRGDSTIEGRIFNHGLVAPGASFGTAPGTLTITGQYWQGAEGTLAIELASAASYDKLDVLAGNLDGTLDVTLLGGYLPAAGTSFNILDKSASGILSGAFATLNLPLLPLALAWDTSQLYTTGVLSVTGPGPLPLNIALFNITAPSAAGPPYPAPSIAAEVRARLIPGEPTVPVERLRLSLFNAAIPSEPHTPVPVALAATGGLDGTALDVAFRLIPGNPVLPAASSLDLLFELEAHPDLTAVPVLIPSEPVIPTEPVRFFDVLYDVTVDGVGMVRQTAHFEIAAGQPLLFSNIVVGPPQSPAFHVTFDLLQTGGEVLTAEDLFTLSISAVASLAGDYNQNGVVDAADYAVWRDTLGSSTNLTADGDGSNTIDAGDRTVWQANFGATLGSGANEAAAVPEPAPLVLLALGGLFATFVFVRRNEPRLAVHRTRAALVV